MEIRDITQCSTGVQGADQVSNAGSKVRGDDSKWIPVVRSSESRMQSESANQKIANKSLEKYCVLKDNNSSVTKTLLSSACGNDCNHETDDKKSQTKESLDDAGGGVKRKQEESNANSVGQSQSVAETPIYTREDAKNRLYGYFKSFESSDNSGFREFDFKKFAEVNDFPLNESCIPHSDVVKNSFQRMYYVVDELLSNGVTFTKEDVEDIHIKLTPNEVLDITSTLEKIPDENKAYKLYGELGVVIFSKMKESVQDSMFANDRKVLGDCLWANSDICKSILSLPLVNSAKGIDVCKKMIGSTLTGVCSVFELSEQKLTDEERENQDHQNLVNNFKELGMFFAFKNDKLGKEMLPAAQFATSIGMKMPLFMAEITTEDKKFRPSGFSHDIVGVAIRDTILSEKDFKGFPWVHKTFYHEITHHARSAVGAIHADKLIARVSLMNVFWSNANLVDAIKSQIREYALTNSEEYIAEFSALVLYCLEHNTNPFNYIKDARLWRLYYEFGGPDYAPIIQQKGFLPDIYAKDCDILSDKKCDWCSGYPSKFGIDVDKLSKKNISVDIYLHGDSYLVPITSKIVFPPPPLGYCYTTEGGCIGLKIDKNVLPDSDDCYCSPSYCSLTNGPLTSLLYSQFQLGHHFELLPNENVDMSKHIDSAEQSSTNEASNSMISTIGSAIGTIVRLPVTAVQWGLSWFRPSN